MNCTFGKLSIVAALAAICGVAQAQIGTASPAGTAFTYQGRLSENGQPANGVYDLEFKLYGGPNQLYFVIGSPVVMEDVQVTNGLFTVKLDFGSHFNGLSRWLGVGVRPGSNTGAYTLLATRQELTPAPYAVGLALPFSASNSAADVLFTLSNPSGGGAMALSSSGGETLNVTNTTGFGINAVVSGSVAAVRGANSGSGNALYGQTTGGGASIFGYNLGNSGHAGFFRTEGTTNANHALEVQSNGTGAGIHATSRAGRSAHFENTSPSGVNGGVLSTVAGGGIPMWAKTTGTSAAGRFDIDNAASNANALEVNNAGNGLAAKFNGGDVQVNGNMFAQVGTVLNRATPIGWGTIDSFEDDLLRNSSGNVIVTHDSGSYKVQLVGEGDPSKWVIVTSLTYEMITEPALYICRASKALSVAGQPGTGVFRVRKDCIGNCNEFQSQCMITFAVYKGF